MTKFFEIDDRDGPARIGKLYVHSGTAAPPFIQTPYLVDSSKLAANVSDYPFKNIGTLWSFGIEEGMPEILIDKIKKTNETDLLILPRNQFSLAYPEEDNNRRQARIYETLMSLDVIQKRPTAGMIRPNSAKKTHIGGCLCDMCDETKKTSIDDDFCDTSTETKDVSEPKNDPADKKSSFSVEKPGCDVYIMEGAGTFENDAIGFFEAFLNIKERIPADAALWLPNLATPENVSMLVYLGADLLDTTRAEVAACSDKYMTTAGTFFLEDLTELPCRCTACFGKNAADLKGMAAKERFSVLLEHNINALESEMSLVREKIRKGALREYVEGQCRTQTWLTGLLRLFDRSPLAQRMAPTFRRETLYATTSESQNRAEIQRFAKRVISEYIAPPKEILIIFPCASKKPYSISTSHQKFIQAIEKNRKYVNELIMTSPIGIVPRELELTYPAAHYDTTVTGHWDLEERAFVGGLLEQYLTQNKNLYKHIAAHVEGPYREICESVSKKLDIPIIFTAQGSLASQNSLKNLRMTIDHLVEESAPPSNEKRSRPTLLKRNVAEEKLDQVKAVARYQFGSLADALFTENTIVKGNFPKFMILDETEKGTVQLAVMVPQFGMLALSIAAAQKLIASDKYAGQYTVQIDNFLPKGSLLAPGIRFADPAIRFGDDVIILGENVIGVGKAKMSGIEMNSSSKGIAVLPRHTQHIDQMKK
ncbi:MAG: archaeosine synthase subunit alpha [Methanimicrococcus sp.]|nr:archaeosine synthase subunit alpha [Methanimicrococcus sp.]